MEPWLNGEYLDFGPTGHEIEPRNRYPINQFLELWEWTAKSNKPSKLVKLFKTIDKHSENS